MNINNKIGNLKDAVDTLLVQSGELAGLRAYIVWRSLKYNVSPEVLVESENQMGGIGGSGIVAVLHDTIDPDDEEFWDVVEKAQCGGDWFEEEKFLSFLKGQNK